MDFTKFSDENFDLKNWINSVFVTQKDTNQNVEVFFQIYFEIIGQIIGMFFIKAICSYLSHQITSLHPRNKQFY